MIKNKTIWIVLVLLILINIGGTSLFSYMLYRISNERNKSDDALAKLSTELKKGSDLVQLADALENTASERQKIESYFVDIKGSAKFLQILQSYGEKAGAPVRLNNVDVENKTLLRIDFSTQGNFESIYRLTELLESTPYVADIKSISMNKVNISTDKKDKQDGQLWSASLSINLLSFINK